MGDATKQTFRFVVNGEAREVTNYPLSRLLDVLREDLGLTGSKEGCGEGECGACSILLDGKLVNSCLVPLAQAEGAALMTIEGVASGERLHRVRQAFVEHNGAQCGICTPGMIMAALELLAEHPEPTLEQIREGLAGNLCRCTGYVKIFEAVVAACQQTGGAR